MIIIAATLLVAAGIDVDAPASCVDARAVLAAVDAVGGLDPAERVRVKVDPAPAADPFVLDVDLALIAVPALHRRSVLRSNECADIPALVAALVEEQRGLRAPEPDPPPAPAIETPAPPRPPPNPRPSSSSSRSSSRSSEPEEIAMAAGGCGTPNCDGALHAALGGGYGVGAGLHLAADVDFLLTDDVAVVVAADTFVGASGGGYAGLAWHAPVDVVAVSLRASLGAGAASRAFADEHASLTSTTAPCPPDGAARKDGGASGYVDPSPALWVGPRVGARASYGWGYAEAGAVWQLGFASTPIFIVDVGVNLLPD